MEEAIQITQIFSVAGLLKTDTLIINSRPFRAPHHSASAAAIIGGGRYSKPGEISLATGGVLFFDEFPEFHRDVIESLRQPLEDGRVTVARAAQAYTYPADFLFIAACNPCPCGFFQDDEVECKCSSAQLHRYRGRFSGPILDRLDIHIEVPRQRFLDLAKYPVGETSATIRKRVVTARELQKERYRKEGISCNSQLQGKTLEKYCVMTVEANGLVREAFGKLNLSMRSFNKVIKVARTIADLEQSEKIRDNHVAEALQMRFSW